MAASQSFDTLSNPHLFFHFHVSAGGIGTIRRRHTSIVERDRHRATLTEAFSMFANLLRPLQNLVSTAVHAIRKRIAT
jgi:hypothetical protein